ncbi:MAG: transposase family protein, partial [Ketobacter sp.]|nr:transposase family protein [Ketobacter sp.]
MLAAPSGSLSIFAGHRVSEIKTESGPTRWLWVPTQENISDLGTRCSATPADLGPGSAWQDGPSWLQLPESSWPTKANMHGEVPAGEIKKTYIHDEVPAGEIKPPRIALAVSAEPESRPIESEEPPAAAPQLKPTKGWFPIEKYSCLRFAKKVMVRILKAADEFKMGLEKIDPETGELKHPTLATGRTRTDCHELRAYAHNVLIASCHEMDTTEKGLSLIKNLSPTVVSVPVSKTAEAAVIMMSARIPADLAMSQDANQRPIINGRGHLGKLIFKSHHDLCHGGVKQTINRSRGFYWVTQGSHVCRSLIRSCLECIIQRGKPVSQMMAPLPAERIKPSPPFTHTAVDLAGPFSVVDTVKRRTTKKVWIAVFVCRATGAVDIAAVDSYSCDSFMVSFKMFTNRRGTPSSMLSDHGTQLSAAAAVAQETFHMEELQGRMLAENGIVWDLSCVGSPHTNGQSERAVGQMKTVLSSLIRSQRLTYTEFLAVLSDVEAILNSRPYSEQSDCDPTSGFPLTPAHCLGEKASYGTMGVKYTEKISLVQRAANVTAMTAEFW